MAPLLHLAALLAITALKPVLASSESQTVLEPVLSISPGFDYGTTKVRGVNLGGWLVLYVISFSSVVNAQFVLAVRGLCSNYYSDPQP